MIGMVIHSLSDGLALGAAVFVSNIGKVNMVVVFIIALHKIPECFGFGSYVGLHNKSGW